MDWSDADAVALEESSGDAVVLGALVTDGGLGALGRGYGGCCWCRLGLHRACSCKLTFFLKGNVSKSAIAER
jgi:hypothetical protein